VGTPPVTVATLPETQRKRRGHRFYPSAAEARKIPTFDGPVDWDHLRDQTVHGHYFVAGCDWWVTRYDPATGMAFGYACLNDPNCAEWGDIPLTELEEIGVPMNLISGGQTYEMKIPVERDCYWTKVAAGEANLPGTPFYDAPDDEDDSRVCGECGERFASTLSAAELADGPFCIC